ncbi:MAG: 50S ribosomal protein L11 methyltransferase [Defluviitaleaceae bacterium]|nr:50S ribosomal protein L11 methyltransferase [Defluviitaleaceae bacterium]
MEWLKATIKTNTQEVEVIVALLIDMGIYGVEINDPSEMEAFFASTPSQWDYVDESILASFPAGQQNTEAYVVFYVGTDDESTQLLSQVRDKLNNIQELPLASRPALFTETVNDESWLHEWKKHFHPFMIGRVHIVPKWETTPQPIEGDVTFTIDPGSAFGTGQHATTMLCIEALQDIVSPGDEVLDIGCGSGILSIISLLLGSGAATACDIDPSATEVTKRNAALNPINPNSLQVYTGNILTCPDLQKKLKRKSYNIVIANIVADVIIELAPHIRNFLTLDGTFIASGIICERLDDVKLALKGHLEIIDIKVSEGWCCVVAK